LRIEVNVVTPRKYVLPLLRLGQRYSKVFISQKNKKK